MNILTTVYFIYAIEISGHWLLFELHQNSISIVNMILYLFLSEFAVPTEPDPNRKIVEELGSARFGWCKNSGFFSSSIQTHPKNPEKSDIRAWLDLMCSGRSRNWKTTSDENSYTWTKKFSYTGFAIASWIWQQTYVYCFCHQIIKYFFNFGNFTYGTLLVSN